MTEYRDLIERGENKLSDVIAEMAKEFDSKSTPKEARYTDGPVKHEPCKACAMFITSFACTAVQGRISPDGHCKLWEAKGATDAEFKEGDHPRDDDGKFGSGGGGTSRHVKSLQDAGTNNQEKFESAFNALKSDKSVKVTDLHMSVAERTQGGMALGKTADALLDEIRRDWIRRSRFENKIAGDALALDRASAR